MHPYPPGNKSRDCSCSRINKSIWQVNICSKHYCGKYAILSSTGIPLASGSNEACWICFVCSSFQVSITFKVNICSFSFWRIYRTWPVSSDVTPVYQKLFKSVKPFMSYRPETVFLFLVTVTLTLAPPAPISNLTCIFWCYTCVPKIFQICLAFHELSSGNHENRQTDRPTDKLTPIYPLKLRLWGYKNLMIQYFYIRSVYIKTLFTSFLYRT